MVDGHQRVSPARKIGQEFIDAEVRECATQVDISRDLKPEDLEMPGTKVQFLERTNLDEIKPGRDIGLPSLTDFHECLSISLCTVIFGNR